MAEKRKTKIQQLYLKLLGKYGTPKDFWQKWCKERKTKQDREAIVLGAMLTQRVSWLNVEKALKNLKTEKALSIKGVYQLGKQDIGLLERLIRPSGFYKQKAKRVFGLCKFIVENHGSLEKFFRQDLEACRQQLLSLHGIGPETADSILLYAGGKPIFVIDEYTHRFAQKHGFSDKRSYSHLQELFQQGLPKDVKVYQDFHAMIVLEGRGTTWDLISKI
ncbi:MAG: endonuclease III domain-containing protein [Candidatus Pacebacteria bacterium]|nr:endonuclease III domain-containing protein [Candidatus Paceibacterota bacterium]